MLLNSQNSPKSEKSHAITLINVTAAYGLIFCTKPSNQQQQQLPLLL